VYRLDSPSVRILEMVPSLVRTPTGWLAISARTDPLNIAVVGGTEDEARDRFRESAKAWARLHDAPDPDWAEHDA
jgi:hypothetical protein